MYQTAPLPDHSSIMSGLTHVQRDAARQPGTVVVLAGAGTGKTRTLVAGIADRICRRGIPAHRILAVTFTNKAAGEMRSRIEAVLGSDHAPRWVGTFHGHGRRQLRNDPDIAGLREGFDIYDAEDSRIIVRRLLEEACAAGFEAPDDVTMKQRIRSVSTRIALLKERLILPNDAVRSTEGLIASGQLHEGDDLNAWREAAALYRPYQSHLREANKADFADLLLWPTVTMLRDETYRRDWAGRFDAVLTDEFQDVNRLQYLWLQALSRDHGELFCVGDDAQSIFGWRGASVSIIRSFLSEFPHGRMIALEENFRSTGHILAAANAVIAADPDRLQKTLYTAAGDGAPLDILSWPGGAEEAKGIVDEIARRGLEGVSFDDMAILYRFNFQSRQLEEALLHAHIPYELVNDTAFWQRVPVKDALALLRLCSSLDDRQSDEAFRRMANRPRRGIGAVFMARLEQTSEQSYLSLFETAEKIAAGGKTKAHDALASFTTTIREIAGKVGMPVAERLRMLLERTGYLEMHRQEGDEGKTALENLHELCALAEAFPTLEALFDHAALGSVRDDADPIGRVKLMTIHGSKGLEFAHVFLPGWEDTLFPSTNATADPAEERRLAYVALTRGRRRVSISWCRYRGGRPAAANVFIDDIPQTSRHLGWPRRRVVPNGGDTAAEPVSVFTQSGLRS
ncbi:DNA helicase II [Asaia spathodeae NBRC 105894]|uniref:DNA 3'-5' helicase n=2 Tax=Acetobacteraceae TaxID=433 RepID=A0ABX2P815_9PROT|nr:DNA helicase II [Asaia spathodeae NBRC 105894]